MIISLLSKIDGSGTRDTDFMRSEERGNWILENPVAVARRNFNLQAIAEKRGLVAWHCLTLAGQKLPDSAHRRRIEREVAKAAHEHLVIFTDAARTMQSGNGCGVSPTSRSLSAKRMAQRPDWVNSSCKSSTRSSFR